MTARPHLTPELIGKIADSIGSIPPKPASRRELELLVAGIEAQVRSAQEQGYTYAEIAERISASGYPIKSSTLRIAMQHRSKNLRTTKKTPGKQPSPQTKSTAQPGVPASSLGGAQT